MPVGVLFCKNDPPLQKKMSPKLRSKMSKPSTPENKIVKLAEDDDSITVTYTLKLSKDKVVDDELNPHWREACWAALKSMRNLDDEVVIRPGAHLDEAFKDFGKTDCKTVNTCFMAEALTQAMLSKTYKEYMAERIQCASQK
jgi:hypothetical protein